MVTIIILQPIYLIYYIGIFCYNIRQIHEKIALYYSQSEKGLTMIINFSIEPEKVLDYTTWNANLGNTTFPLIFMDRCSYIVSSSIESGINFDIPGNRHHIQIGKYASIGHNLKLNIDLNHDYLRVATGEIPELKHLKSSRIKRKGEILIGNDVWIGQNAVILPGVHIGDGAIIGANSVVGSNVEPYTIVAGNPARAIRKRFDDELIGYLLAFKWWDKSIEEINGLIPILTSSDLESMKEELRARL